MHPTIKCEDVHPEIAAFAAAIVRAERSMPDLRVLIKAGFGFGDVNACVVFGKAN
jgi:3-oxoacyl-(acyl-carrier-protein) synthase